MDQRTQELAASEAEMGALMVEPWFLGKFETGRRYGRTVLLRPASTPLKAARVCVPSRLACCSFRFNQSILS